MLGGALVALVALVAFVAGVDRPGGNVAADPTLNERISRSYNRRMGR